MQYVRFTWNGSTGAVSYTHLDVYKRQIVDLATRMIELAGYRPGEDIEIKFTGLRPGEKLYEEVLSDKENTCLLYTSRCV